VNLEVELLGKRLFSSDLGRPPTGPSGIVRMAAVEGVVDHDLAPGEELDVRTAHTEVLDLLMGKQIVVRHDVERLAHAPDIGRTDRRP
jgi:hypothetical protein